MGLKEGLHDGTNECVTEGSFEGFNVGSIAVVEVPANNSIRLEV